VTLLYTHAWVWLVAEPKRLSARARRHIDSEMRGGPLFVSSMSVWEVTMLSERGRLALNHRSR
jgi:PIN domain nuclease of toxin-antitoxin system